VTAEITSVALCVEPPSPAPIAAFTVEPTEVVVTLNVAEVAPAGTVTLLGTVAADELLLSATTTPPAGGAPDKVTVPCDEPPPVKLAGFSVSDVSDGGGDWAGLTVRVALRFEPPRLAPMLALTCEETDVVVTVKAAFSEPAGTVTEAGTPTAEELLLSATVLPPLGAALESVTVPCDCVPPVTVAGLTVSEESEGPGGGGLTVRVAFWFEPPRLAPMLALTV